MKYSQLYDGEWFYPYHRGARMQCCDCSLVHRVDFKKVGRDIAVRMSRDRRATAKARKRKHKK